MTITCATPSGYTDTMLQLLEQMNQVAPSDVSMDSASSMESSSSFEHEPFVIQEPHGMIYSNTTLNVEPETPLSLRNLIQHTPGEFFAFQQHECSELVSPLRPNMFDDNFPFSPNTPVNKRKREEFETPSKRIKLAEPVRAVPVQAPAQVFNFQQILGPNSGSVSLTQDQVNQLLSMLAQQTAQGPPIQFATQPPVEAIKIVAAPAKPKVPTLELPPKTPKRRQKKSPETPTDEQPVKYLVCRGGIKRKNKKAEPGDQFQMRFKLRM
jgi:hypothetical protein